MADRKVTQFLTSVELAAWGNARKVTQLVIEVELSSWPSGISVEDSGTGSEDVLVSQRDVDAADSGVGSSAIAISISGRRGQSTWW